MFYQGVDDPELAIISHVDNTMIRAHFRKNLAYLLETCGLSTEDWDVAYILNFEELARDLGVQRTDPVPEAVLPTSGQHDGGTQACLLGVQ